MQKRRGPLGFVFGMSLFCAVCQVLIAPPWVESQVREVRFPIGELIPKGEIRFEGKENVWKDIPSPHFPIFEQGRIKTGQGTGLVALKNNCHLEIAPNSLVSFEHVDRMNLSEGKVLFRIPSNSEMTIGVGRLIVTRLRVQQASKSVTPIPSRKGDTIGSITVNPNGSVTIRTMEGSLSILDQDRVMIASLPSRDSVTIPAIMALGGEKRANRMVAQAGEVKEDRERRRGGGAVLDQEWTYLGLNAVEWIGVKYTAALLGGLIYLFWPEGDRDRRIEQIPVCP